MTEKRYYVNSAGYLCNIDLSNTLSIFECADKLNELSRENERLERKIQKVHRSLVNENEQLKEIINELNDENEQLKKELKELNKKYIAFSEATDKRLKELFGDVK